MPMAGAVAKVEPPPLQAAPPPLAQAPGPPPLTQAAAPVHEPVRALREAHHEDPRPVVRAALDEVLPPIHTAVRDLIRRMEELEKRAGGIAELLRRVEELEKRPAAGVAMRPAMRQSMASYHPPAPQAPVLDVAAINRDVNIQVDGALDGNKRRRRLALTFVVLLLVVFGGLFGALAHSYTPHGSSNLPSAHSTALV
jgi:hypothetical protein